jgi:hypothetical protein
MKKQLSITAELQQGSAFYVAVQAVIIPKNNRHLK